MKTIRAIIVFTLILAHYACSSQIYSKHRSKVVNKHSDKYDFYKVYYGEYAKKKRVDKWHNIFINSHIKVLKYSYKYGDVLFTERYYFTDDGCLDSVSYYQTYESISIETVLSHKNELQRFQTFYKNGFYKEHGYYSGTSHFISEDHRLYIKPNKCYYYEKDFYSSDNALKMGVVIDSSQGCSILNKMFITI